MPLFRDKQDGKQDSETGSNLRKVTQLVTVPGKTQNLRTLEAALTTRTLAKEQPRPEVGRSFFLSARLPLTKPVSPSVQRGHRLSEEGYQNSEELEVSKVFLIPF